MGFGFLGGKKKRKNRDNVLEISEDTMNMNLDGT